MTDPTQAPETPKAQPIETLRDGRLSAAIWANPGQHGPIYNATLSYSYQDKDGNWKDTQSIPGNQLLKAAHLSEKAYETVSRLKDRDRAQYVEQQRSAAQTAPEQTHDRDR